MHTDATPQKTMGQYTARTTCRFCDGTRLTKVLDFGPVPLAGGFLKPEERAREEYYPLDLSFCEECTLVQVTNAVSADTLFRKHYFYYSSKIQTLVTHSVAFAQDVYDRFLHGKSDASVFEIGCNDGVMLRPFVQLGVRAVGMDPASNVVASVQQDGFTIHDDFFSRESAARVRGQHGQFDAITTSYSFAHIDDMRSVMDGVDAILKPDGVLVFEVYYLGTLIEELQYDMIYHEHMSYYSLSALRNFLARWGMEIFDVYCTPGVRSGAARFYARRVGQRAEPISQAVRQMERDEAARGYDRADTFRAYGDHVAKTRSDLLALLQDLKRQGKCIIGYGASGRGTTIMNYCGIDGRYLEYVVDDAPAKHGYLTPGTHVPIHPWSRVEQGPRPDYALLFAWSFAKEVVQKRAEYLRAGGHFIVPLPTVQLVGAEGHVTTHRPTAASQPTPTVVILGATGMLGSALYRSLRQEKGWTVIGTARRPVDDLVHFDVAEGFETCPIDFRTVDYVMNCIGITKPYCHDDRLSEVRNAIAINALFPHLLAERAERDGFRVVQIATDCVFSGTTGGYTEDTPHDPTDMYGRTKSIGEVMASPRFLNVRCSIIGPEQYHKAFLLEWFLAQPDGATVNGFSHHRWNGVTTFQFAALCREIIWQGQFDALIQQSRVHHFAPNPPVTKYELLTMFREIFGKPVTVHEVQGTDRVDRTLATQYGYCNRLIPPTTIRAALQEIHNLQRVPVPA